MGHKLIISIFLIFCGFAAFPQAGFFFNQHNSNVNITDTIWLTASTRIVQTEACGGLDYTFTDSLTDAEQACYDFTNCYKTAYSTFIEVYDSVSVGAKVGIPYEKYYIIYARTDSMQILHCSGGYIADLISCQ